jgi:hypothetical protein
MSLSAITIFVSYGKDFGSVGMAVLEDEKGKIPQPLFVTDNSMHNRRNVRGDFQ